MANKNIKIHRPDLRLFIASVFLIVLGILILSGIAFDYASRKIGNPDYYFFHQLWSGIFLGIICGLVAFKISLNFLKKIIFPLLCLNILLMALVFVPGIGVLAGGAVRWLNLVGHSFQPSEFLKLTFVLYLSLWLSKRSDKNRKQDTAKKSKATLIPFLSILSVIILLLYFQHDLSTLAIISVTGVLIYFLGKTPLWHTIVILILVLAVFLVFITFEQYRFERILVFFGILEKPLESQYQPLQALISVGSGGFFGFGLGMSSVFVPQSMTDSIFAVFAQEAGFAGALFLIFLFTFFLFRCLKISLKSDDEFFQFFSAGVGFWIYFQVLFNISSVVGLIPVSGVPLPFVSYGGSHIVAEMIALGLLLNISKYVKK